jgi:hypothetical protein
MNFTSFIVWNLSGSAVTALGLWGLLKVGLKKRMFWICLTAIFVYAVSSVIYGLNGIYSADEDKKEVKNTVIESAEKGIDHADSIGMSQSNEHKKIFDKLDSPKVAIRNTSVQENPIFGLSRFPNYPGIAIVDSSVNYHKVKLTVASMDGGSSFFSLRQSFVVRDLQGILKYSSNDNKTEPVLPYHTKINKGGGTYNFSDFYLDSPIVSIFIWLRGNYKRIDGSGNFSVDEVYEYDIKDRSIAWLSGSSKQNIINVIKKHEK